MEKGIQIPNALKSASVYMFANLLSNGLVAITIPIFTRIMSTEQIGVVNIYTSWFALISSFSTLSLTAGGFSLAMKEYKLDRDAYVSSVLFLTTIIAIAISCVFLLDIHLFEEILGMHKFLILLMCIGFLFSPARSFWLAKERYEYSYKLPAVVTIISSLGASALSIVMVIWALNNGVSSTGDYRIFANYSVIYFIDSIIYVYLIIKGKRLIDKKYWKYSLGLSLPLVGYSISTQILNVSDRMMIDRFIGKSEVGIYGTLYAVGSIPIIIWVALNASYVPYLFENIEQRTLKLRNITNVLLLAYSVITILMTFFSPEIVSVLATDEYVVAMYIMPPIAAGVFMIAVSNIYSNILVYYKKTSYIMYASIVAAIGNIVLNYLFIKDFGYVAAAYTTLFSYIVLAMLEFKWAQLYDKRYSKQKKTIYDNGVLLLISIATVFLCFVSLLLYEFTTTRYIVAGVIGIVLLAIIFKNRALLLCR